MSNRKLIEASKEHQEDFRKTRKLREDVHDDPYWQDAYNYAAEFKLYPDELEIIAPVLIKK